MEQKTTMVKKRKHRLLLLLSLFLIAISMGMYFLFRTIEIVNMPLENNFEPTYSSQLFPNSRVFDIFVADDPTERSLGLSVFNNLSENQVMLFVFDTLGNYPFWMKDMKFPIDIVWLDEHGVIVFIKENAQPSDYPNSYNPKVDALYVVEFVQGFVNENSLDIGQKLQIHK